MLGTFKISERNKGTISNAVSIKKVYDECQGLHPCYILVIVFAPFLKNYHKGMCFAPGYFYLSTLC